MSDQHKNFSYSLVATAPSPAISGTSLVVTAGQGALFPTPPFNITIWPANLNALSSNAEIVRVTAIATDTLTIVRAQEGTAARTVVAGDQVAATITAKTLQDIDLYTEVTGTSQTIIPMAGYIANNAGLVTFTLPVTSAVGDVIFIVGKGAGGWKIAQNALQVIHFGDTDTLVGITGYISSTNRNDSVRLICIAANTEWLVSASVGNITILIS